MAYKMKGHTLPGINQRSEGNTDLPDGRSASSPFQKKKSPATFAWAALIPAAMSMVKGMTSKKKEEE